MNKKGFTLIELVMTIALLSIIAIISFVSINKVIEKNKVDNCETVVESIKMAVTEYVSDNRYNNSFIADIDNTYVKTINDISFLANRYLSTPVHNPFKNEDISLSTITVKINFNGDYTVRKVEIISPDVLKNCTVN